MTGKYNSNKNHPIKLHYLIYIVITIPFISCAVNYKSMDVDNLIFQASEEKNSGIRIFHLENCPFEAFNNKRYHKIAVKKGLCFIPVKVVNAGNQVYTIEKNKLEAFHDYEYTPIVGFDIYSELVRQPNYILPYGLLSSLGGASITSQGLMYNPYSLALFVPIGTYNFFRSRKSNAKCKDELETLDIIGKTIRPGEELYGIICIKTNQVNNLLIRINP
jgi:hypothetical protein